MNTYNIPDSTLKNLLVFLERVTTQGINEQYAMVEIVDILKNKIDKK